MNLQPKKVKYKKVRKGRLKQLEFKSNKLKFGTLGIKSQSSALISARQIEAARRAITRTIKRKGKLWIRIFPNLAITAKPNESRMGKGKGSVSYWVSKIAAGTVLFEICGISPHLAKKAFKAGSAKLPVSVKFFD